MTFGKAGPQTLAAATPEQNNEKHNLSPLGRSVSTGQGRRRLSLSDMLAKTLSRDDAPGTPTENSSSLPAPVKISSTPFFTEEEDKKDVDGEPFKIIQLSAHKHDSLYDFDIIAVHSLGEAAASTINTIPSNAVGKAGASNFINAAKTSAELVRTENEKLNLPIPEIHLPDPQSHVDEAKDSPTDSFKKSKIDRDAKSHVSESLATSVKNYQDRKARWFLEGVRLTQDFRHARVLLFQYPEPVDERKPPTIMEIVQQLSDRLLKFRQDCTDRPILFIGHDFGVTIIERYLMHCARSSSSVESICRVTIGIVLLWTSAETTGRTKNHVPYFEIREPRLAWTAKSDGSESARKPPYTELNGPNGGFIERHLTDFKNLYKWLSRQRPALALFSMRADSIEAYPKVLNFINENVKTYRLLNAAGNGDEFELRSRLNAGANVNSKDSRGRSALHIAVRGNCIHSIRVLLGTPGIDPCAKDNKSRNALHYAADYCSNHETLNSFVQILVDKGVSLDAVNDAGVSSRQAVLDAGVKQEVLQKTSTYKGPFEQITIARPDPDPPTSEAALKACHDYLATLSEFYLVDGQEQIIIQRSSVYELLYDHNSGPEKILSAARGQQLKGKVCKWYHLPANHLGWVDDLFVKMGLITEPLHYDQHIGTTYWSRYMRPQARIFESLAQNSAQRQQQTNRATTNDFVLYMPFLNFERRCDLVTIRKTVTEAEGEDEHKKWARSFAAWKQRVLSGSESVSVVEALEALVSEIEALKSGTNAPPSVKSTHSPAQELEATKTMPVWNPDEDTAADPNRNVCKKKKSHNEQSHSPLESVQNLVLGYLAAEPYTLHHRRTLDQSHYFMLTDTSKRDADQVVLRRQRKQWLKPKIARDDEVYPLVMVDQLWMWVIDDTIITSFPQKWMQSNFQRDCDVMEQLMNYLQTDTRRAPVRTIHDLTNLIVTYCVSIFNRRSPPAGLQLHDLFESSVGKASDHQMTLFRNFEEDTKKDLMKLYKNKRLHKVLDKIFTIKEEIKLLDEIKDIRDELNIILRILNDQALSVAEMMSIIQPNPSSQLSGPYSPIRSSSPRSKAGVAQNPIQVVTEVGEGDTGALRRSEKTSEAFGRRHRVIDANIRDFERMLTHANHSYDGLNHLLDLKQKQANSWEARLARLGAESSARQSNTIVVFTIATIVFGSLSFVTAFFTLNVTAYPHIDGSISWHLGQIIAYIVLISIGLSIPFIYIAFKINFLSRIVIKSVGFFVKNLKPRGQAPIGDENEDEDEEGDGDGESDDDDHDANKTSREVLSTGDTAWRKYSQNVKSWITRRSSTVVAEDDLKNDASQSFGDEDIRHELSDPVSSDEKPGFAVRWRNVLAKSKR